MPQLNISRLIDIADIVVDAVLAASRDIEAMKNRLGVYVCVTDLDGITHALISVLEPSSREKRRKYSMLAQNKCADLALMQDTTNTTRTYADPELERYVGAIVGCDFIIGTSGHTGDLDEVISIGIAVGMRDITRERALTIGRDNPHQDILHSVLDAVAGYP